MFKLLKGGLCYSPAYSGVKDIFIVYDRIHKVEDFINADGLGDVEIIDCTGKIFCPGFIDQHVHILGGGGEEGPSSRIPELMLGNIISAGVSTLVGVLGVDSVTRNIAGLLYKARALELEGISTFIYTGSYSVPTATLTGKIISDIAYIDKVLGAGEIAIADYRSSHPTVQLLKEVAVEARIGGMISGKAGVVHIHVGDGKEGLSALLELVGESDFPVDMFVPTHINRNRVLFQQAVDYAGKGGQIDLTAGESSDKGYSVPDALKILSESGIDMARVTVSSDGNGSMPAAGEGGSGVGRVDMLFNDVRNCILDKKLELETVLRTVTENVARVLKLYPKKGALQPGSDADVLVLNRRDLNIDKLFVKGELLIDNGIAIKKGRYEKN